MKKMYIFLPLLICTKSTFAALTAISNINTKPSVQNLVINCPVISKGGTKNDNTLQGSIFAQNYGTTPSAACKFIKDPANLNILNNVKTGSTTYDVKTDQGALGFLEDVAVIASLEGPIELIDKNASSAARATAQSIIINKKSNTSAEYQKLLEDLIHQHNVFGAALYQQLIKPFVDLNTEGLYISNRQPYKLFNLSGSQTTPISNIKSNNPVTLPGDAHPNQINIPTIKDDIANMVIFMVQGVINGYNDTANKLLSARSKTNSNKKIKKFGIIINGRIKKPVFIYQPISSTTPSDFQAVLCNL